MDKISVIVPCYNEEEVISKFVEEIKKVIFHLKKVSFEIIFVDDGSTDNTLHLIKEYCKERQFRYISFSRNFGKEAAMLAGLKYSTGNFVAIMDADLQDPPDLLEEMYTILKTEDYDSVGTRRVTRKGEPVIRSFFARLFYKIINKMSKVEMVDGARDFRLMKRNMVDAILELKEYNRYSKGIFSFVGFKTKWLEYENIKRVAGVTKWNFKNLFVYAIEGISSFTTLPLYISFFFAFLSFLFGIVGLFFNISFDLKIIFIIISIFFTFLFLCLGVFALYISKMYLEMKNRPIYIIRETDESNLHKRNLD